MPEKITIDAVPKAISDALAGYRTGAGAAVKRAVDRCAKEMDQEIRVNAVFRRGSGAYLKAFQLKTVFEDEQNKRVRWQVKAPHYRLTHLLEHGHRIVDRNHRLHGTTKPVPHIAYGEALAQRRLPELIEEEMGKL
jgi:hypothetical protein